MLLVLWEVLVVSGLIDRTFLPPAHAVILAFWDMLVHGELLAHLWATVFTAFVGLGVAVVLGVFLGALMATNRWVNGLVGPLVATTYSLPKTSLVPLFILWFGIGDVTNGLTVVLGCLLPILVSTHHGVSSVPAVLVWSARAMGTPQYAMLRRVLLPAATASILSGVRIALGYCFVLVISAEMIATKLGIGKLIFLYGENGAYAYMLGGILAVVVIAFVADRSLVMITRRLLYWHDSMELRGAHA
ncbi:MAG: ABC transporter permease [Hyphomicrobiaceae bacterium]|nr:ABC transporter permease [Hyphomicrobiaceae bacterium]